MIVSELIERLREMPQDAEVFVPDDYTSSEVAVAVELNDDGSLLILPRTWQ